VTAALRFTAYGTSFGLRASDRSVLAGAVRRASGLGWTAAIGDRVDVAYALRRRTAARSQPPGRFELWCDDAVIRRTASSQALLEAFEDHAKLQTACHARNCLFVHAGAVAWRGCGILVPGRSRAGKTTFVTALIQAGAEYYSDEFAVIDCDGRVHPYALPLSLRRNGPGLRQRKRAEELGARAGTVPVPVDLIVVTQYRRGARWRPRVLSNGEALLALMENTVAARRPPEQTMPILRRTVVGARAIQSARGNAAAAAPRLLAEFL